MTATTQGSPAGASTRTINSAKPMNILHSGGKRKHYARQDSLDGIFPKDGAVGKVTSKRNKPPVYKQPKRKSSRTSLR